jgi:uncharacterized membrane protein
MKKLLDYRILLVLWISIGISLAGYYFIYPPRIRLALGSKDDDSYYQLALLVTIVGSILIGGIGYVVSKKKEK